MSTLRRRVVVSLLALVAAASIPMPAAGAVLSAPESALVALVNAERQAAGLRPLALAGDLVDAARRQARTMAAEGRLFHTVDLRSVTTGWTVLGENVAMAPDVDLAHRALMGSAPHRANILEPRYNQMGVGVVHTGSTMWLVEIFAAKSFTPPFSDDEGSVHETDIARLALAGVTTGCAPGLYCPSASVSREQMATLLTRALDLTGAGVDLFVDDDGSWHEPDINAAAGAGVTTGCGSARYCPTAALSRADMAVWLVNALGLSPVTTDYFSDDDGWPQESAINSLAAAGVTRGCRAGGYCPGGSVTRAQMASFLVRAFGF